jgi:predicted tellurium resistance membrane protein TerC
VERLPAHLRDRARISGLLLAMVTRVLLLFTLVWITHLTRPLVQILGYTFSGRDLVLLAGGLFLLVKSVLEMHHTVEGAAPERPAPRAHAGMLAVIVQIGLIDIVFSLDSVFTAIGLVRQVEIMVAAIVVAILVMMAVSSSIAKFISQHPTIKVLALAFLLLIGLALVAEGVHFEIPKGYLYFAMAFSVGVELINMRVRRRLDARRARGNGAER